MRKDSFWLAVLIICGVLFGILYFLNPNLVYKVRDVSINFITSTARIIWNKISTFGMH